MNNNNPFYQIPSSPYILYISQAPITLIIEDTLNDVYWSTTLTPSSIEEMISKIGAPLTSENFFEFLKNSAEAGEISFKSLNELTNDDTKSSTKEFLIVTDTSNKQSYPIKMEFQNKTPDAGMYKLTINRLKRMKCENSFEKENKNLKNKIKILESQRPLGAVEGDNLLLKYTELVKEFEKLKEENEKYKSKTNTMFDNGEDVNDILNRIHNGGNNTNNNNNITNNFFITGGGGCSESNVSLNEIDKLVNEIKLLKEHEKEYKEKINSLEKIINAKKKNNLTNKFSMFNRRKIQMKPIKNSAYLYSSRNINTVGSSLNKNSNKKKYLPPISINRRNKVTPIILHKRNDRSKSKQEKRIFANSGSPNKKQKVTKLNKSIKNNI